MSLSNVQTFAAAAAPPWSITWCAARLLDPILRRWPCPARKRTQPATSRPAGVCAAFAATELMNTWTRWGLGAAPASPAQLVVHAVPALVVLTAAKTRPGLRERLTETVHQAVLDAQRRTRAQQDC